VISWFQVFAAFAFSLCRYSEGTRLNRDALRAFLNDNVEQLAHDVKLEVGLYKLNPVDP
jgi:hypothetical protein